MDTRTVTSICNLVICISIIINVSDYNLTRGRGFFMFPRTLKARRFFMGWSMLLAVLVLLNFLHLVPIVVAMVFLGAYVLASQGYAVFCRHRGPTEPR
jgi:hypothetical protein